jgi:glycosyltransferase involved in cell wall biosynthesis
VLAVKGIAISVVVPLFNKEGQVARTVQSVLGQRCGEFELIIVDDGSTDGSRAVVASLRDQRIRVVDQRHAGVSAARNRGIEEARAKLIAFCDADDEWEPDHLESLLELSRRHPEAAVCATGYWFSCPGEPRRANILRGVPDGFEEGLLDDYFRVAAMSDPPLCSSSVAARVDALRDVGLFPPAIGTGEDLLTWARLAERYPVAYRRRPTAIFWLPRSVADRPGRVPAEPDAVGEELARMLARAPGPRVPGLAAYLSLWHRMRGVIYLKLGNGRRARAEFERSLHRGGWSGKVCALWLLGILPHPGKAFEYLEQRRNRLRGACR